MVDAAFGHLRVDDFNLLPDARDLRGGETMIVFPESSRSRSGRIHRFRDGRVSAGEVHGSRPVIPVAIHGSFACFPPEQPWVFPPIMRLQVLGVLYPDASDRRSHLTLKNRAHGMIQAALETPEPALSIPEPVISGAA